MLQRVPPPEDPLVEEEVEALRERLAGIQAELDAGRYADALEHVEPVVQRAEALGYEPLLAEALVQRGIARDRTDEFIAAERDLEQAFTLAAEHGHDAVAAKAVTGLTWIVGVRQGRHEPGIGWGRTALALSGGPEVETTAQAGSLTNIGIVLQEQGKLEEALAHYQRALATFEQVLGKHHSSVAGTLTNIGSVLQEQGKLQEALTHYQRALATFEQALGKHHSKVAGTLGNIGNVLHVQGKLQEALTHQQRALAIKEQVFGKHHSSVATTLGNIGGVLREQGKLEEALTHQQRALAIKEQALGKHHPDLARTLDNIGLVLQDQGKLEEALTHYQRALAIYEQALGKHHPDLAYPLVGLANVALDQRKLDTARAYAERGVSLREAGKVAPFLLADARFALARALWDDRAERKRSHALAQQARDALAAAEGPGESNVDVAKIDAWLAGHRVR